MLTSHREEFRKQLTAARAYKGMPQWELGKLLGYDRNGYWKRENGKIDFSLTDLYKIATIFGKRVEISEQGIFLK